MRQRFTHLRVISICIRYVLPFVLAWAISLQSLFPADRWSRVTSLKRDTWVYVTLKDGNIKDGWLVSADDSTLVISSGALGTIELKRELVFSAAVDKKGRHWYAIPLAFVVGASAGFAGYEIARHSICSDPEQNNCKNAKVGSLIGFLAGASGGAAYRLSRGDASKKKIIYQ